MDGSSSLFIVMPIVIMACLAALIGLPCLGHWQQKRAAAAGSSRHLPVTPAPGRQHRAVPAGQQRRTPAARTTMTRPSPAASPDPDPGTGGAVRPDTSARAPVPQQTRRALRREAENAPHRKVVLAAAASASLAAAWLTARVRRPRP